MRASSSDVTLGFGKQRIAGGSVFEDKALRMYEAVKSEAPHCGRGMKRDIPQLISRRM
jgi:hypothetical protein